jgi:hypothetical protein
VYDFIQVKLMNKLQEILISYVRKYNPTDDQKFIASERLQTCMGCEFWVQGQVRDYCSICRCTTSAKVFSPIGSEACPMGKWVR